MSAAEQPIYVVLSAHGGAGYSSGRDGTPVNKGGPIVHEMEVGVGTTLDKARERAAMLDRWGPCRIGRVVFEDVDGRPL